MISGGGFANRLPPLEIDLPSSYINPINFNEPNGNSPWKQDSATHKTQAFVPLKSTPKTKDGVEKNKFGDT